MEQKEQLEQPEQKGTDEGNTGASSVRKNRKWFITLNNYSQEEKDNILEQWNSQKAYVIQEEMGKNGTPHLQGCVWMKNPRSLKSMKIINERAHWEVCKSWKDAVVYCSKEETKNGERWSKGVIIKPQIIDPIKKPRRWQRMILNLVNQPRENRIINWIIDRKGNKGKTSLTKHLCITRGAIVVGGKGSDMRYAVAKTIEDKGDIEIVCIDLARTSEGFVSYEGIENIKNGIFFSGKYESGMCIFNSPHILVFSNYEPDYEKLSKDRWNIIDLDNMELYENSLASLVPPPPTG